MKFVFLKNEVRAKASGTIVPKIFNELKILLHSCMFGGVTIGPTAEFMVNSVIRLEIYPSIILTG